jgi:hypothetical protein
MISLLIILLTTLALVGTKLRTSIFGLDDTEG